MTKVITQLSTKIKSEFKKADEIWVAVALLNNSGLELVLDSLKENCKKNFLVGIDLPTDPKALRKLYELQLTSEFNVRIHTDKQYFHPKLYLSKYKYDFTAFIGSANCTNGGLNSNVELSLMTKESQTCEDLKNWFEKIFDLGKPLTLKFLAKYQADYDERLRRKKEDEKIAKKEKRDLKKEVEATFIERREFIKVLKSYKKSKDYKTIVSDRKKAIKELRRSIDYPNFKNIDVDWFFKIWDLGHLISIPKPTIKREITKFRELLIMLCDDKIDLALRYNSALEGKLKIRGIGEGLISKILIIHNSNDYYVKNDKSTLALQKFGIELPKGLSKGEKYKITIKVLKEISEETLIEDLAVLDYYLYVIGNEETSEKSQLATSVKRK
ncbi:HKD family nuclease [Gillisia sp. Hel_I_86]|uniref:phospholipase D-like domain-containing protein n=1 Tax=Gillisia sp. Hel_I_86 TaxID=1249981 RepID=UPI0011994E79|nr:phospholipase D-like domain-containing protein [Gillisia sp. Hel_I_86]TVZ26587.1 HKD family nuclease [Gillisia sp. Hel_I_86]TVZ28127.1 HKD family nuclease [Gillisia sp. Hel_I_86]